MAHVVTYDYSFDDYLALIRARRAMGMFGGVGGIVHYVLAVIAFLLILAGLTDWNTTSLSDLMGFQPLAILVGGVIGIVIVIALIDYLFDHYVYRLVFRRFALAGRELTVTLDDDGIRWSGKEISAHMAWSMVKRVQVGRDHVALFFSRIEGLVLPRRALSSDAEFRDLTAYVERHAGAAAAAPIPAGVHP